MSPESTAQTPCIPAVSYRTNDPRKDGWTPDREAGFVAHLADHGVVAEACRAVGMGISGAYALRRRPDGIAFDLGWKAAMILARERLSDMLMARLDARGLAHQDNLVASIGLRQIFTIDPNGVLLELNFFAD